MGSVGEISLLIKEIIKTYIIEALSNYNLSDSMVIIEIPKDRSNGDYSSNLAFLLAKNLKKSPLEIANELAVTLNQSLIGKGIFVSALKGFLNFNLEPRICIAHINQPNFALNFIKQPENILIEYVSANPTGPLHIGHGRWAALGDSLVRILARAGHQVESEFYINDAGSQIAKLLMSVKARKKNEAVPDDGYNGDYIKELINCENPIETIITWQKKDLMDFHVIFNHWTSEKQSLHDNGKVNNVLSKMKELKLTYTNDGALFFESTRFGDDKDRVLIKENGELTYFAADIAYHESKAERGYDRLINIWGADHHGYIARIKASLKALHGEKPILEVLLGQLVTLFREGEAVRMSKRTGDMISLREVIDEIGTDATRFFLVMKSADTHLDFDLSLAKKQSNENPVFYVQYAHARICSILSKKTASPIFHEGIKWENSEIVLLKTILRFEDELVLATSFRQPHRIAQYLQELAADFHAFYQQCKVNSDDIQISENRLALISKVRDILAEGLDLLGVSAPTKM